MTNLKKIEEYAEKCYADANCTYGDGSYMIHIHMVNDFLVRHVSVFKNTKDATNTMGAADCHDLIEDAKQTYNNIYDASNKDIADIVLSVTDVPAQNRLMKHLLTMGKTVQDYRVIILKMADIWANDTFSKTNKSSMYGKYVAEYPYRKTIFQMALKWYKNVLDQDELDKMWNELDNVHGIFHI